MSKNYLPRVFNYPANRSALDRRLHHASEPDPKVRETVRKVINRVRRDGAKALVAYARQFDGVALTERSLRIKPERMKKAWASQPPALKKALALAKNRIEAFHKRQRRDGFTMKDSIGATLIQRVHPLQSVGVYIPGFMAAYPSTAIMNIVPAKVAGVKRIVAVTPPIGGRKANETILATLHLCGVDEVYQVGGAQAVAALAYGAGPVPAVDKVVGPGNAWVQAAKGMLYVAGLIDIDMIAGPTEVLVLADKTAAPNLVASDMLAQAEHTPDTSAWAILIGDYDLGALLAEIERQTEGAPRGAIIKTSLKNNGVIVRVKSRQEAADLANRRAPEHVSVKTRNAEALAKQIHSAGAVFLGDATPEPIGDYIAGPNHVLPTGRTARFSSPLSVDDFVRTDHVIHLTEKALAKIGPAAITLAEAEGLHAHAQAIRERLTGRTSAS
jgi:histidinol dehydrogenase